MPSAAESAVLLCPAPKTSCSLSSRDKKPEIPPSSRILERVMDRDADWEAAD